MARLVSIVALVGAALMPCVLHAQIVVGVEPWDSTVAVGQSFEMEYWIGGLGNHATPSLASFDLTMDFDSSLVAYTSATVGPMLGDVGAGEATASTAVAAAAVNVTETSLLTPAELIALQPSSFVVFRVRFVALAEGNASFEPGVATILDENGAPLNLELGALAIVHIVPAQAIPTISAWGMAVLIGALLLAGLVILRRT